MSNVVAPHSPTERLPASAPHLSVPRRCQFPLRSASGEGTMAAVAFGPDTRPVDLVFAHANGFNAMTYRQLLAPLGAAGWHVLAIDQRGHGRSQLPADPHPETHTWRRYRDDLLALYEVLGGPPRVQAGHSMGGTASVLAAGHLQQLGQTAPSLVLFDPVMVHAPTDEEGWVAPEHSPLVRGAQRRNNHFDSVDAALASYLGRGAFKTWPESVIRDYLLDGLQAQPDGSWQLSCQPAWEAANFTRPMPQGLQAAVAALRGPMQVLLADIESTSQWTQWPAQAQIQVLPGSTHFLPMEFPEIARAALLQALRSTP